MRWQSVVLLLVGMLLGYLAAPRPVTAQAPHGLFISSSAGAVLAQGSTAGVLTVTAQ